MIYEDECAFDGDCVVDDGVALQNYFDHCTNAGCNIKLTRGWYNTSIPLRLGTGLPTACCRRCCNRLLRFAAICCIVKPTQFQGEPPCALCS